MGAVQNAVERRDQAPAKVKPQTAIRQKLDEFRPVIGKLLAATGIDEATFIAQIANACRAVPELWTCDPDTVLGAALKCAQLGLAPNDVRNLAWILPYGGKAQFQLGYGGVMELARRAVPGLRFDGRAVYPNDEFDLDYGKAEPLTHRPAVVRQMDRGGDAYAWYVRATFPDGTIQIHALDRDGVEYHRKFSKQPNGKMWKDSYDAAALKSVVNDMKRWLPSSAQLVQAFNVDADDEPVEATYGPPEGVDQTTGEVLQGELVP
jgi:recombination protein RecT